MVMAGIVESSSSQKIPSPPRVARGLHHQLAPPLHPGHDATSAQMMMLHHEHPQQQHYLPPQFGPSIVEQFPEDFNHGQQGAGALSYGDEHLLGTDARNDPFAGPSEADMLRFQHAGLTATRRAMEAKLKELRQQEERLGIAAAIATARSNRPVLQMPPHTQQQQHAATAAMQRNQFSRPSWLPMRPPPPVPPMHGCVIMPSSRPTLMCPPPPQNRVYWKANVDDSIRPQPSLGNAGMTPIHTSRLVMSPPPSKKAHINSAIVRHSPDSLGF